jgi:hypothetical protein
MEVSRGAPVDRRLRREMQSSVAYESCQNQLDPDVNSARPVVVFSVAQAVGGRYRARNARNA